MRSRFFSVSPMYLRHRRREVDAEDLQAEPGREHLRGHRLAGAGLAREQDLQALRARDRLLVAPVRQHAVAVAQVGGDRLQQLALALGDDEVLPAVAGREPGGELAEPRGGGLARAEVDVGRRRRRLAARGRGQPRDLGGLDDLRHREPELRGHVAGLGRAGEVGPGLAALGEARRGGLDEQHRALAERERGGARRRRDHGPLGALLDRAQQPRAIAGLDVLEPFEDHRPVLERARSAPPRPSRSRSPRSRTWTATSGRPSAIASSESASGPASTTGRWLGRASSAVTSRHRLARGPGRARAARPAAAASAARTRPCARRAAPRPAGRRP